MADAWPYGVQPASLGMNFSAVPATSMWADTCPFDARQFQGLANETLPSQTDDQLANVLNDIGLGPSNSSQIVVDIKAFMNSLGNRPIYSRSMLQNAAKQLTRAQNGQNITLADCYAKTRVYPARDLSLPSQVFVLGYNGLHHLATASQDYRISNRAMLPVYVGVGKKVQEPTNIYDIQNRVPFKHHMQIHESLWLASYPHYVLLNNLKRLKHTARITNIVCIGLGTLQALDPTKSSPTIQHIVASSIAQDLERIYKAEGIPLERPISIIAQDPAYNDRDRLTLSELPVPIKIVSDPEGFLAINESSLVFSSYPVVPVKQLVADLSSEAPGGKGPAALFLNNNYNGKTHGNIDFVRYDWDDPTRYADPETSGYMTMLESYTRILDGEWLFGEDSSSIMPTFREMAYVPGYE